MKRIVISMLLLSGIAALCFWSVNAVNGSVDEMLEEITLVEREFSDGNSSECVRAAENLREDWRSFLKRTILLNDPDLAAGITETIAEIYAYAGQGSDELPASCSKAEALLKLLKSAQSPTPEKVL